METERLMRIAEFCGRGKRVPVSLAHWYAMINEGKAPQPMKLGRAALWRSTEIDAFVRGEWKPERKAA